MCRTVPKRQEGKGPRSEDSLITVDLHGVIRSWSSAARQMWGYSAEQAVGRHISFLCGLQAALARRSPAPLAAREESRCALIAAPDSNIVDLRDEAGRPLGYAIRSTGLPEEIGQSIDGSEQSRLDAGGTAGDTGLGQLLRHLPGAVHSCAPEYPFVTTFVSEQVSRLFGFAKDDFLQTGLWLARIHPDDLSRVLATIGRLDRTHAVAMEYRFRHKDGTYLDVRDTVSAVLDRAGGLVELVGFWEDITEERHSERARQERERLRLTAMATLDGQESERARISRELHDDLNQRLGVLILDVAELEKARGMTKARLRTTLRGIRETLKDLSRDVHDLALRLHPPRIDGKGLRGLLEAECSSLSERTSIDLRLMVGDLPAKIPPLVSLCLFRVAREALNNVVKHSRATRGRVTLEAVAGGVRLSVEDFGIGFDQHNHMKLGGLGIMTMEERVRVLGGSFSLHSKAGQGTCVTATVPLSGGSHAESTDSLGG